MGPGPPVRYFRRANKQFNTACAMEVAELESNRARITYVDTSGVGIHPLDCEYNRGLLSCVPALFGHRPATVSHPNCACDGADCCVYDVSWEGRGTELRYAGACAVASATAIAAPLIIAPALVPLGVVVAAAATGAA